MQLVGQLLMQFNIVIAKTLKLGVIAEGVETEGQRKILQDGGCSLYQGYLFGKPMPLDEFEHSLGINSYA